MTFHLFQIKNFVCQLGCVRFVNVNDIAIVICDCKAGGVPGILTVLTNNFNFPSNEKKKKKKTHEKMVFSMTIFLFKFFLIMSGVISIYLIFFYSRNVLL